MSVSLKLADQDAKLVGDILRQVARIQEATLARNETSILIKGLDRLVSSIVAVKQVDEIAGAFQIAVRANQR